MAASVGVAAGALRPRASGWSRADAAAPIQRPWPPGDHLRDEEIAAIVSSEDCELQQACDQLVQCANDRGGEDNVTVVLVRYEDDSPQDG